MNLNESEMRETAARICRDYLNGAWRTVKPQDLLFKRISGGLSNFLYHVALPESAVVDQQSELAVTSNDYSNNTSVEIANESSLSRTSFSDNFTSKYRESFSRKSSDDLLVRNLNGDCVDSTKEESNLDTLSQSSESEACGLQGEPKQVLLRIYGQIHGEQAIEAIITESVIFTLLSERRLGPKLHGVFPGGRIEQYIPARPLLTGEMSDPVLCVKIAEKMSAIHSMHVPLSKEPDWLWKTMNKWISTVENNLDKYEIKDNSESSVVQRLKQIKLRSEIEWLKQIIQSCRSPVVFSHNDMQEGNILLRQTRSRKSSLGSVGEDIADNIVIENSCDDIVDRSFVEPPLTEDDGIACDFSQQMALKDNTDVFNGVQTNKNFENIIDDLKVSHKQNSMDIDCCEASTTSSDSVLSRSSKKSGSVNNDEPELVLIDFEYCSYNYRGFDLANHFIEWTYDYSNEEHPYFYDKPQDYPTQEQQERFITAYLQSSKRYRNGHLSPSSSSRDGFSISRDVYDEYNSRSSSRRSSGESRCSRSRDGSSRSGSVVSSREIAEIMDEIKIFSLASHLFWGMWACVNASLSQIPFGYWDYAGSRLNRYLEMKKDVSNLPLSKSTALKRKITDIE